MKTWLYFTAGSLIALSAGLIIAGKSEQTSTVTNNPNAVLSVPNMPTELVFAGEKVPMTEAEVMERLDRELLVNTFWHSNTILMLKRANRYFPVIEPILKSEGVPDDFKYLCMIESGLANVVSPSNAAGFWQFLSSTGKRYGLEVSGEVDERYHLEKATKAACAYLKDNKARLGTWTLAAAAYNMGENGVEKQLKSQGVDSYYDLHLNPETARYLFRILAAKEIHSDAKKYGFKLSEETLYQPYKTRSIEVKGAVESWPEFALEQGTNYKYLKILNPWIRDRKMKNSLGTSYTVLLPNNTKTGIKKELEEGSDE
ncbi:MAG: lytic transglycosylase domain-containing protein [Bacteroidetes bacterium]|nr:MAG: lytic transglycosylase domain-containing protein [Bacteroidota bacterium]